MDQQLFDETTTARDKVFESLGSVCPDVIAHAINPAFMGGPVWPALRQAFSIIRTNNSTIISSNGLADPFDDEEEKNSGFAVEVMAEANVALDENITDHWLFKLVYSVSQQAANSGVFKDYLDKYGVITMELFAEDDGLEAFQNDNGMVGIMIGVEHPERPKNVAFPGGDVCLAMVKILTPDELDYVCEHGVEGRNELHRLFNESKSYHFNQPKRKSVLRV